MSTTTVNDHTPAFERDGGTMPVIGLGTFQSSGETCRRAVSFALEIGYRHVDTARMYKNEAEVGRGIRDATVARDDIFLTTKLQMGELDAAGVRKSCETSLRELGTDYVDLLLIHWPEETVALAETFDAMRELKQEGKINHLGVSNFTVDWLNKAMAATQEPIFCNQIEYHPYIEQGPPMRACHEGGIGVVAYSPLARGRALHDEKLTAIGKKHGKTAAQVALRWLVRQQDVIVIPKATGADHIRDNLDVFDFTLDEDDLATIGHFEHGQRLINPDFAPRWDT